MKNIFTKIWIYILKHKIISFIALVVIVIIGYQIVKSLTSTSGRTLYTVETVTRGTLISTVSGTGQVSASDQVDLKTQASGELTYLNAVVGQEVKAGTLIAQIDNTDAAYQLENAKLSYDKLVTVDPDTLRKDQNAVTQAQTNLTDSYTSAVTSLSTALTDLSDVDSGLTSLFDFNTGFLSSGRYSLTGVGKNYRDKAETSHDDSSRLLSNLIIKYRSLSAGADNATIKSFVTEFNSVSLNISQATKDAQDAVIYLRNNEINKSQTVADAAYTSVVSLVSKAGGIVSSLSSTANSIDTAQINLTNAQADLKNLQTGPDTLTLRTSELSVSQAQKNLDNYSVTAPFDGIIAAVNIKKGDTASNGTAVATLITKQKIAEISLNEIDAAKIKTGQKVTATFDALPDLTLTGTVTEVDLVGAVSQGVVSYSVQVSFDVNDDRVKSGMTVSVSIITEAKTDVLTVPSSAIKTQGSQSYVEVFDIPPAGYLNGQGVESAVLPRQQIVTTGTSNDSSIEILSGLKEGDYIVTKTVISSAAQTTSSTASIGSLLGGNRAAGTANRATTGGFRPAGN